METDQRAVNLLWTGGWDSTFRVLELLLLEKKRVQPHYLIDSYRRSTGMEIRAMRAVKDRLFEEHPHTRELLLPTRYCETADAPPDEEIAKAFRTIGQREHIGEQYDWLARFCKQAEIFDMEMCIYYVEQNPPFVAPFAHEYPEVLAASTALMRPVQRRQSIPSFATIPSLSIPSTSSRCAPWPSNGAGWVT